MLQKLQG